ncbi:DUF342 domain-containing protein [Pseudoalteromonas mariniglutinosa]|uniref:DUF342 domain-containing protein n=1 Tax=Pseudoalteromonas mariniglutinosa TaxID=206042 RepID=UPI00384AAF97
MSLFSFDQQTGVLSLLAAPCNSGFPATITQLINAIEQSPYAEFEINYANIEQLFSAHNEQPCLHVAQALDASLQFTIDEKKMFVEATLITAKGGQLVTMDEAKKHLHHAGIIKGVNNKALDNFLGQQFTHPAGSSYSAIIAHGRQPKEGADAKFMRLCCTAQDRILSPQAKADGKVDMRDLGAIITVKPGAALMQRIPADKGENGYTIYGDVLPAQPGKDYPLEPFEGTCLDPNNPNMLIAESKGVPVALARGMRVDDILCCNNVDVSTGHIDFDGSVIVSGDVKDGMKVRATGDITVLGFVESADIDSGSEITIVKGAIGRKRENNEAFTCAIKATRTISVGYAQYCLIHSTQDLFIERQALHCDLSARRLIRVGKAKNPRGKIIGGSILDAMRIETGELGAPSGTKTRVFIAQYWHELRQKQLQISEFEKLLASKSAALQQARAKATAIASPTKRQFYLDKITASEQQIKIKTANTKKKKYLVKQKMVRLLATSQLKVNELMHPGIELKIARESKQFSRIYPAHFVHFNEGKITQSF